MSDIIPIQEYYIICGTCYAMGVFFIRVIRVFLFTIRTVRAIIILEGGANEG